MASSSNYRTVRPILIKWCSQRPPVFYPGWCPIHSLAVEERGSAVEYLGVICVVLVTRQPLMPYYVLNIADARIPFTGVIGMTNVVPSTETAGLHLTYLPKYVTTDDPLLQSSDDEVQTMFLAGLKLLLPEFEQNQIVSCHVNRAPKVQPLQVAGFFSESCHAAKLATLTSLCLTRRSLWQGP